MAVYSLLLTMIYIPTCIEIDFMCMIVANAAPKN